jgi:hypothetical protein
LDDPRSFRKGVLGNHAAVKGFRLVGSDGPAGRVSWASYAPGERYLVTTVGVLRKRHRVVPAGAVSRVSDGGVYLDLTRSQIERLPLISHPRASVYDDSYRQMLSVIDFNATPGGDIAF